VLLLATVASALSYFAAVWPKDEQRIEEERAGIARPAPATLASSHLAQGLDAFDDACSPEAVFAPRKIWPLQPSDSIRSRRTLSEITPRNLSLAATLFIAFAAEAFVNNFLEVHDLKSRVSATKFKNLDRGSTVQKYVEGVTIAYEPIFGPDDEAIPAISELFEVRNKLVHARPGIGPPIAYMPDATWRSMYPPTMVAKWLIAVAGAAELLEARCYGFDYHSFPAAFIWHGRNIVTDLAARSEPLPDPTMTGRAPAIQLLADEAAEQAQRAGSITLTIDELREVRLKLAAEIGPWDKFTELVSRDPHAGSGQPSSRPDSPDIARTEPLD
jgi:hypothetical protein